MNARILRTTYKDKQYIYIMFENVLHKCVQFNNISFHAVTINLEDKLSLSVVVNVNLIYQIKTEWKPVYFLFVLFINGFVLFRSNRL
mgnify:CR=1 FL=1